MTTETFMDYGIYATRIVEKRIALTQGEDKQKGGSRKISITLPDLDFERTEKADSKIEPSQ